MENPEKLSATDRPVDQPAVSTAGTPEGQERIPWEQHGSYEESCEQFAELRSEKLAPRGTPEREDQERRMSKALIMDVVPKVKGSEEFRLYLKALSATQKILKTPNGREQLDALLDRRAERLEANGGKDRGYTVKDERSLVNDLAALSKILEEEEEAKKAEHSRATKEGVRRRRERLTETPEELYSKILQNKITNALPLCSSRHAIKTVTGGSVIKLLLPSGELTIELPRGRVWDVHTSKTADLLLLKLTDQLPHFNSWDLTDRQRGEIARKRVVTLTLDEYMKACALSDVKSARDRLNKSLDTLFEAKVTTSENVPKRGRVDLEMRIATARAKEESRENPIKGGRVAFAFSQEMAEHLSRHGIMPYPRKLLLINTQKYRHAYQIGRYLAGIQYLSAGKEPPYRVSVECVMKSADLPTYDEIMQGDRHIDRKIMEPLHKNLAALVEQGVLESVSICKENGEELSDEDLPRMDNIEDFKRLNVKFKFPGKYYEALKSTTPPKKRRGRPPKAKAANSPDLPVQPVGKEA